MSTWTNEGGQILEWPDGMDFGFALSFGHVNQIGYDPSADRWRDVGGGSDEPQETNNEPEQPAPEPEYDPPAAAVPAPAYIPPAAYAPALPQPSAPAVSLSAPASVRAGESFAVRIAVSDPDGDLDSAGIRWQGRGLVGHWDLSGGRAEESATITAPDSGPLFFRGEVWDRGNHGVQNSWIQVDVVPAPVPVALVPAPAAVPGGPFLTIPSGGNNPGSMPQALDLSRWVHFDTIPYGGGYALSDVQTLEGAPNDLVLAVAKVRPIVYTFGTQFTEDDIYHKILAELPAGWTVPTVSAPRWVGYDAQNWPVYQETTTGGIVLEYSLSPTNDRVDGHYINGDQPRPSVVVSQAPLVIPPGTTAAQAAAAAAAAANSTLPPVQNAVSPLFDPVHRLAGWDVHGNEVYQLTDEAGTLVEWAVPAGHDSREMIPGSFHHVGEGPSLVASHTPPIINEGGAVIVGPGGISPNPDQDDGIDGHLRDRSPGPTGGTRTGAGGGNGLLVLALGVGGFLWWKSRNRS